MTVRLCKTVLALLFFSAALNAGTIGNIRISGARAFSQADYIAFCGLEKNSEVRYNPEDSIRERISVALRQEGYFHFSIKISQKTEADSSLTISIAIDEGVASKIGGINITGLGTSDSAQAFEYLTGMTGKPLSKFVINEAFSRLLSVYENSGFPFARILIDSLSFRREDADLSLRIIKGRHSLIDRIEISGNQKTKFQVVQRTIGIGLKDTYCQQKIDMIRTRLGRLNFLELQGDPVYYLDSRDQGALLINVKEKETSSFDGILGYIPNNGAGYFTGLLDIYLGNVFGSGREASFKWKRENAGSSELELKYKEPWILGYQVNLSGGLYQRKQDSTYIRWKYDGELEYLASEDISASLLISKEAVYAGQQTTFSVYSSDILGAGSALRLDTRDDSYSPQKGILFKTSYCYSRKSITGPEKFSSLLDKKDFSMQKIETDLCFYLRTAPLMVASLALHFRELRGGLIESSDLYLLGGTNSLRGYQEGQFRGRRIFFSNLEYRYLTSKRGFLFAFLDNGYYLYKGEAFKTGYGFGTNIETPVGVLSVSYALSPGTAYSKGMIHFGILNKF